jgi:hypothetical protein
MRYKTKMELIDGYSYVRPPHLVSFSNLSRGLLPYSNRYPHYPNRILLRRRPLPHPNPRSLLAPNCGAFPSSHWLQGIPNIAASSLCRLWIGDFG